MPRHGSLYPSPIPSTPRRQPPRLGVALHSPSPSSPKHPMPRRATSTPKHHQHPQPTLELKLATPRHGTPRLGVEPDLQHVLPMPRPCFGVCTTHNPTRIPRNHP
ncbi:hypothetical protein PIB30_090125 [Stylosanthes scabra]|uniref:Uncharacterized protein n=1 Tax=Stylosanthes scabra TaxID=79078 RepID=A0ABU6SV09_9FABA|nr:hypothetical protein [Stylosanthes scabra]